MVEEDRFRDAVIGEALPGLTPALLQRFADGKTEFNTAEEVDEGLGPVFNDVSCVNCHNVPASGGGSDRVETRFGRSVGGQFDALAAMGGSLIQERGIGKAGACNFVGETVPAEANVRAGRRTTPLFGLGLADAVPDATYQRIASAEAAQTPGTAGRPNMVTDLASGRTVIGKFGWKAQVPSLAQFSGDAYLNEMGITSPLFPNENCPQGNCALLSCNPMPTMNDAGDGTAKFTDFMTMLGPPPRGPVGLVARAGEAIFTSSGCASCHRPTLQTGPSPVGSPGTELEFAL